MCGGKGKKGEVCFKKNGREGVGACVRQFNSNQSEKVFKIQLSKLVAQFSVLGNRKVKIFCHKVFFISRKKGSQHLYSFIFKHRDTQETLAVLDR